MIVAISGKINSGKTTMSNRLVALGYRKVSFADWLKETCADVFNFPLDDAYDQDKKQEYRLIQWLDYSTSVLAEAIYSSYPAEEAIKYSDVAFEVEEFSKRYPDFVSIRECLQLVGTELIRHRIDVDYHVTVTLSSIGPNEKVVIDDLRFPNEAAGVAECGGLMFRIDRQLPEHEGVTHASETALDNFVGWTEIIDSNCSYEQYCANVDDVILEYSL